MSEMNEFLAFAQSQAGIPPEVAAAAAAAQGAAPGQAPPQAPPQAVPPQAAPKPPTPETAEGKAQAAMAPATEGTRQNEAPIVEFEIPGRDGKPRKVTSTQVAGVMDRYASLNFERSQLAPVINLAKQFLSQNPGATPQDLVDTVIAMTQASQPNAQMGRRAQNEVAGSMGAQPKPSNTPLTPEALRRWEEENATSLPPGYAEMMTQMQQFGPMMQQQQSVLQQLLAQASGVADASRTAVAGAQTQAQQAQRMAIANNLDRAQQALQLPDDRANDFMMYAGERGYLMEDFADPQLTYKVMQDFRNQLLSGEMDRIKQVHNKRMAYTGIAAQTPNSGAPGAPAQGDADFDSFVNQIMSRRSG